MQSQPERLEGLQLPPGVRQMEPPATVLYLSGNLGPSPRVALVGTRHPTGEAAGFARSVARALAEAGVTVLSGGAEGIDRAAHHGALDAAALAASGPGRRPHAGVVVAPSSFDRPYPEAHGPLFREILQAGGGFVTEYEGSVAARRHQFFRRNALLVALSDAVVLVQAPLRSGARNAAKWARSLGKPLFAAPSSPWIVQGRGCNQELAWGALVCRSHRDVLRELERRGHVAVKSQGELFGEDEPSLPRQQLASAPPRATGAPRGQRAPSAKDERAAGPAVGAAVGEGASLDDRVLSLLWAGPAHLDTLAAELTTSSGAVQLAALRLALAGRVQLLPTGVVRLKS